MTEQEGWGGKLDWVGDENRVANDYKEIKSTWSQAAETRRQAREYFRKIK